MRMKRPSYANVAATAALALRHGDGIPCVFSYGSAFTALSAACL
jgi:hypothetical protein